MHHGVSLAGPALDLTAGASTSPLSNSFGAASAAAAAGQAKDDLKTQFVTREGTYRVMALAEYSRPNRVPLNQQTFGQSPNTLGSAPVRVSFLEVPPARADEASAETSGYDDDDLDGSLERICFNVGRELYVYVYRGIQTAADLTKPIDKRVYKGTFPTCHAFNQQTATRTSCSLLIGFSAGQVQLIDPFQKEYQLSRLYNEERFIEKTAVTCIKWVPGQPQHFLVSHASGCLYLYNEELACPQLAPVYQLFKQGDRFAIYTCKTKSTRNPMYKWQIGEGSLHQFEFSGNDARLLATDGYLRIFNYHAMELVAIMRSYFGGLLCLAWSPDSKLVATGGEDDLLTVYSVAEKRIICRGQGHKSWISQVAFDPFTCELEEEPDSLSKVSSAVDMHMSNGTLTPNVRMGPCYRIGTVGHDTQLCLWDVTEDFIKAQATIVRHRNSTVVSPFPQPKDLQFAPYDEVSPLVKETKKLKKLHRRGFSIGVKLAGSTLDRRAAREAEASSDAASPTPASEDEKVLGTRICPRMDEIPVIEPLICKKIAHERLTVLEFRRDCIVTACQEGFICTWARPGRNVVDRGDLRELNSPALSANNHYDGQLTTNLWMS